jgi:membrane-anchored protein YejM (alkaline phosphatase superfamily)
VDTAAASEGRRALLAHLFFATTAALLFALGVEWPHHAPALGLDAAGAAGRDRFAMAWLLVATSLAPLLPFQALAFVATRRGSGAIARRLLAVATLFWALWLVLDVFVQSQFGAHLAGYLPFATGALWNRDQLQWVGDPAALAFSIAKLLVATAFVCLVLQVAARHLAARVASRRVVVAFALLCGVGVVVAFPAQHLLASPEVTARVAMRLPYSIEWPVSAPAPLDDLHLLGLVPWPWRSPDLSEIMIYNPRAELRSAHGWQLENATGQRIALHGEIAAGATLHLEVENERFGISRHADSVTLIGPAGETRSRLSYRDEDVKRGAVVWNSPPAADSDAALAQIGTAAQQAYAVAFPKLRAARHPTLVPAATRVRSDAPNVILLVVESLRADVIGPALLARLGVWSAGGLRAEHHYSGSNSSHLGLFSLLFSRLPLFYDAALDADATPAATRLFRELGYRSSYVSSGESESWKRMNEYLGEPGFDEVVLETASEAPLWKQWPDCDRRTLAAIQRIAREPGPHFIVGFLMGTHFPYPYPPSFAQFGPVSHEDEIGSWSQLFRAPLDRDRLWNRYRNAALSVESQLVEFAASLDPQRNVIAITGDHGESFGEDGALVHGSRASDAQTQVPLLIVGAGVSPGTVTSATSHLDVLPTLLHAATGVADPVRGLDGRDLLGNTPPREDVFVAPYKLGQPYEVLWLRGERRVLLRARVDRPELAAFAFVDASGFPLVAPDPSLLVDTTALVSGIRDGVARLAGEDGAPAAPVSSTR